MKKLWLVVAVFAFVTALSGAIVMPPVKQVQEFQVMGIAARTSNAKEMTADGEIPKQWQKFFRDGILAKIPHKMGPTIYALYTDYANGRAADYTFLIGARVSDASVVPAGMVVKTISGGRFAVITSEKGPVERVVPQAWRRVWQLEDDSQLGGKRVYKADYELYDQRSQNPQDAQVDIYIGLEP